jgi:hypothetical protein
MAKRLTRKLTDVATEVEATIIKEFNITSSQIDAMRNRAKTLGFGFPVSTTQQISNLWIDYEVQRDVIHKHVLNIMKKWDPRICSPVSACRVIGRDTVDTYDGQHRTLAAAILQFDEIPCAVVETTDPNFPSYAFEMLNDTGVKRLNPGDLHRNALVRYKNGSRETKTVRARKMQDQFDKLGIDLEDKNTRKSATLRGENDYFFSHFKYAQKVIDADPSGKVLFSILDAIQSTWPEQEEIDQGCFIGLYELFRLAGSAGITLEDDWMKTLCKSVAKVWNDSSVVHAKGRQQWAFYKGDGATWTAPTAMSNFMREVHVIGGGKLELPFHGDGSKMGIEEGVVAPGLMK